MRRSLTSALLGLAACAGSTGLTDIAATPHPEPRPRKVLVVGLPAREEVRSSFEADMAPRLRAHGIQAVEGAYLLPAGTALSRYDLRALLRRHGFDAILIGRFVGTPSGTEAEPADFYGYLTAVVPQTYSQNYRQTEMVLRLELRLYRITDRERLEWKAISGPMDPSTPTEVIRQVDAVAVERMRKDGVL